MRKLLSILLLISYQFIIAQPSEKDTYSMVFIPAGEFIMGKDSEKGFCFSPAHKVKVNAFYMDKHEVTNKEYLHFCKATGHHLPEFWNTPAFRSGENFMNYPVIGISWHDATKYAQWADKRLPTEAEWEYAARGGLKEKDYPNGNKWPHAKAKQNDSCWFNLIEPVEKYSPNGYGLFDLGGNVWEWVSDRYAEDYFKSSPTNNPQGSKTGNCRVIKGGSWHSGNMCKKVYTRKCLPPNWNDFAVGLRCVKSVNSDN